MNGSDRVRDVSTPLGTGKWSGLRGWGEEVLIPRNIFFSKKKGKRIRRQKTLQPGGGREKSREKKETSFRDGRGYLSFIASTPSTKGREKGVF